MIAGIHVECYSPCMETRPLGFRKGPTMIEVWVGWRQYCSDWVEYGLDLPEKQSSLTFGFYDGKPIRLGDDPLLLR